MNTEPAPENPSAFPWKLEIPGGSFNPIRKRQVPDGGTDVEVQTGLSYRDYFAVKAMQAFLSAPDEIGEQARKDSQRTAAWAYEQADAMLRERLK